MSQQPAIPFDDGKARDAMRTIGEVAKGLGIKQHILRYWEQQFPMLKPLKRSGGRRLYRPEDITLLARIDRLINAEGYTLKGARQVIEAGDDAVSESVQAVETVAVSNATVQGAMPQEAARQLKSIRNRLAAALEAA